MTKIKDRAHCSAYRFTKPRLGGPFSFGVDALATAEELRRLAAMIEEDARAPIEKGQPPNFAIQSVEVTSKAENDDFTLTRIIIEMAESQRPR